MGRVTLRVRDGLFFRKEKLGHYLAYRYAVVRSGGEDVIPPEGQPAIKRMGGVAGGRQVAPAGGHAW